MSSDVVIKVENLSKCFQIYDKPRDRLLQMLHRGKKQYFREFWAVKDVSFDIKKGEAVGIVGRNGSGKSTLLQLICGTLNPTKGVIQSHGRIAALLELGSGFNPEFSGRENVYMNAAILGLNKDETDDRFDDIVAFADIGDFVEQPVKTYSSGMMVRLAFAVAINVNPKILIVDEALAVGDELFQRKCFSRIEELRANGATILFVSHSGSQIVELCDRAFLMDAGSCIATGIPKYIVGCYQKLLYAPRDKRDEILRQIKDVNQGVPIHLGTVENVSSQRGGDIKHEKNLGLESYDPQLRPISTIEYESHGAQIKDPSVLTLEGDQINNLIQGKTYRYAYDVHFTKRAQNVRFGMLIKTISGVELGGAMSAMSPATAIPVVEPGEKFRVEFRFQANLNAGMYFMNAGVVGLTEEIQDGYLHRLVDIAMFRVMNASETYATATVDFGCVPKIEMIKV